jgi:hypothetical protein
MLPAIGFHDQAMLRAREVHDEGTDRMLASETVAGQSPAAEREP